MAKKKPSTKKEKQHMEKVASLGCIICGAESLVHHIRVKGKLGWGMRSSHYETIPLCHSHHVGNFSIHMTKKEFEKKYGTETELLEKTLKMIEDLPKTNDFF